MRNYCRWPYVLQFIPQFRLVLCELMAVCANLCCKSKYCFPNLIFLCIDCFGVIADILLFDLLSKTDYLSFPGMKRLLGQVSNLSKIQ